VRSFSRQAIYAGKGRGRGGKKVCGGKNIILFKDKYYVGVVYPHILI
jgi:hypothetical protein